MFPELELFLESFEIPIQHNETKDSDILMKNTLFFKVDWIAVPGVKWSRLNIQFVLFYTAKNCNDAMYSAIYCDAEYNARPLLFCMRSSKNKFFN